MNENVLDNFLLKDIYTMKHVIFKIVTDKTGTFIVSRQGLKNHPILPYFKYWYKFIIQLIYLILPYFTYWYKFIIQSFYPILPYFTYSYKFIILSFVYVLIAKHLTYIIILMK